MVPSHAYTGPSVFRLLIRVRSLRGGRRVTGRVGAMHVVNHDPEPHRFQVRSRSGVDPEGPLGVSLASQSNAAKFFVFSQGCL